MTGVKVMRLTPELLEACYEFLRVTPPFRRWDLPENYAVKFRVGKTRSHLGDYRWDGPRQRHMIMISGRRVAHTATLISVMAHEMIHLKQNCARTETYAEHNANFKRLAKIVCLHHGFDPLEF